MQFNMNITKINFIITYLTKAAQNWFELGLNQKDQSILQNWLSNWNLFVNELHWHFDVINLILWVEYKNDSCIRGT